MSLKRLLYTLFLYVIFPLVLLRLLWRSRANVDYRKRWSERLGFVSSRVKDLKENSNLKPIIWIHAVSVGEVIAAKPLIQALFDDFSDYRVLVTTTTPTGSDRVSDIFADQIIKQQIVHVYFPYDLLGSVSRFLKVYEPKLLIIVETEIWPNLYAACHQKSIPVLMVNARLSDKSLQSYMKVKGLISETFSKVSLIAVRSKIDSERFSQLGAKSQQIQEVGNIKYDISIDEHQLLKTGQYLEIIEAENKKQRLVFVAASTHKGEDIRLLSIYSDLLNQYPDLLLIIVPRHPERFDEVYSDCIEQLPKSINVIRHSHFRNYSESEKQDINVILGDSMGEMQMWYSLANIVFIGGSLVKTGGHNPLEVTLFGVPVVSGPHMYNFEDITNELSAEELLFVCDNESEIVNKLLELLNKLSSNKKELSNHLDEKADEFMRRHRGATARLTVLITRYLNN